MHRVRQPAPHIALALILANICNARVSPSQRSGHCHTRSRQSPGPSRTISTALQRAAELLFSAVRISSAWRNATEGLPAIHQDPLMPSWKTRQLGNRRCRETTSLRGLDACDETWGHTSAARRLWLLRRHVGLGRGSSMTTTGALGLFKYPHWLMRQCRHWSRRHSTRFRVRNTHGAVFAATRAGRCSTVEKYYSGSRPSLPLAKLLNHNKDGNHVVDLDLNTHSLGCLFPEPRLSPEVNVMLTGLVGGLHHCITKASSCRLFGWSLDSPTRDQSYIIALLAKLTVKSAQGMAWSPFLTPDGLRNSTVPL